MRQTVELLVGCTGVHVRDARWRCRYRRRQLSRWRRRARSARTCWRTWRRRGRRGTWASTALCRRRGSCYTRSPGCWRRRTATYSAPCIAGHTSVVVNDNVNKFICRK